MNPYDVIADDYDRVRHGFGAERRYVDLLLDGLPAGAQLLDLGCGTGRPITRHLLARGHRVVAVDSSARMLAYARAHVPDAMLVRGTIETVVLCARFDGIVAWDSIFHLPRGAHRSVLERCAAWLRPGGRLLLSLGGEEWEGHADMLGASFLYSGHAPAVARDLVLSAGLAIDRWEIDDPSSRGHVAIVARKVAAGGSAPT